MKLSGQMSVVLLAWNSPYASWLLEGEDRFASFASHAEELAAAKVNIHAVAAVCGGSGRNGFIFLGEAQGRQKGCQGTWSFLR